MSVAVDVGGERVPVLTVCRSINLGHFLPHLIIRQSAGVQRYAPHHEHFDAALLLPISLRSAKATAANSLARTKKPSKCERSSRIPNEPGSALNSHPSEYSAIVVNNQIHAERNSRPGADRRQQCFPGQTDGQACAGHTSSSFASLRLMRCRRRRDVRSPSPRLQYSRPSARPIDASLPGARGFVTSAQ